MKSSKLFNLFMYRFKLNANKNTEDFRYLEYLTPESLIYIFCKTLTYTYFIENVEDNMRWFLSKMYWSGTKYRKNTALRTLFYIKYARQETWPIKESFPRNSSFHFIIDTIILWLPTTLLKCVINASALLKHYSLIVVPSTKWWEHLHKALTGSLFIFIP